MFYLASKSAVSVEKEVFFSSKSVKRGCFSNFGTSLVHALFGRGGGEGWEVGWGLGLRSISNVSAIVGSIRNGFLTHAIV